MGYQLGVFVYYREGLGDEVVRQLLGRYRDCQRFITNSIREDFRQQYLVYRILGYGKGGNIEQYRQQRYNIRCLSVKRGIEVKYIDCYFECVDNLQWFTIKFIYRYNCQNGEGEVDNFDNNGL